MISVPSNIVGDIASSTQHTVANLWPIIILFIAIPLTFYVVRKIQQMFPKSR